MKILTSSFVPLGLIQHLVVSMKVLFQKICKTNLDCDDELSVDLSKDWRGIIEQLSRQNSISVPRCYVIQELNDPFVDFETWF